MKVEVIYDDYRYANRENGGLSRATERSAGHDLRNDHWDLSVAPGCQVEIDTGIRINMPEEYAMMGLVALRSSIGKKGWKLANQVGIIDADYQGKIKLILVNSSERTLTIEPYERVAQLVFVPVYLPEFVKVSQFLQYTDRGEGGFGSTGTN